MNLVKYYEGGVTLDYLESLPWTDIEIINRHAQKMSEAERREMERSRHGKRI